MQAGQIQPTQPTQGAAALGQRFVVLVEQARAERLDHPGASVGARTPTHAEHDPAAPGVQRRMEDFSGAMARGDQW